MDRRSSLILAMVAMVGTLAGCATLGIDLRRVLVQSQTAVQFYYLRTDVFNGLGETDAQRRRAVEQSYFYGPHAIGDKVRYNRGAQYIFVPRCNGRHAWGNELRTTPTGLPVRIGCP